MGHNGKRQLPSGITGNLLKAARFAANFKNRSVVGGGS